MKLLSNHPRSINSALIENVSRRVSNLSSDTSIFERCINYFNYTLNNACCKYNVRYISGPETKLGRKRCSETYMDREIHKSINKNKNNTMTTKKQDRHHKTNC